MAQTAEENYLDQIVERRRKSRLRQRIRDDLIRQVIAGSTALTAAELVGVNPHTATLYFHKLRELIAVKLAETEPWLSGEIEVDESYFGVTPKGELGHGTAGKVPVIGLL